MKAYFHGEVVIKKVASLPKGGKKVRAVNGGYIIAESEQSGNHHLVVERDGIELYQVGDTLYLHNEVEAEVKCVDEKRHDTEVLEPGVWKIDRANEHDFLADETRKVAD